jgi:hypothetical protein
VHAVVDQGQPASITVAAWRGLVRPAERKLGRRALHQPSDQELHFRTREHFAERSCPWDDAGQGCEGRSVLNCTHSVTKTPRFTRPEARQETGREPIAGPSGINAPHRKPFDCLPGARPESQSRASLTLRLDPELTGLRRMKRVLEQEASLVAELDDIGESHRDLVVVQTSGTTRLVDDETPGVAMGSRELQRSSGGAIEEEHVGGWSTHESRINVDRPQGSVRTIHPTAPRAAKPEPVASGRDLVDHEGGSGVRTDLQPRGFHAVVAQISFDNGARIVVADATDY